MTPPVDDPEALRQILANTEALLLDFDGPICSVFAGIPAPVVAEQLRDVLAEGGHTDLPDDVRTAADPFDVLFYAAKLGQHEARYVEAAFRAHEVEAVQLASPTPQSSELMRAWKLTGRSLAVVSNNSAAAIESYLDFHKIRVNVDVISARSNADVVLLKPSPFLLLSAAEVLGVHPAACVLVGDSATDIQASQSAQVVAIGYANNKVKEKTFPSLGAIVTVTTLASLIVALDPPDVR